MNVGREPKKTLIKLKDFSFSFFSFDLTRQHTCWVNNTQQQHYIKLPVLFKSSQRANITHELAWLYIDQPPLLVTWGDNSAILTSILSPESTLTTKVQNLLLYDFVISTSKINWSCLSPKYKGCGQDQCGHCPPLGSTWGGDRDGILWRLWDLYFSFCPVSSVFSISSIWSVSSVSSLIFETYQCVRLAFLGCGENPIQCWCWLHWISIQT